jgi:hypothetical protein
MVDDSPLQPVPPKEQEISFSGPSIFCNRFFVSIGPVVRIAFAEQDFTQPGDPKFRTAVALHPVDAIALYRLLDAMLKPIAEQLDAAAAAMQAQGGGNVRS